MSQVIVITGSTRGIGLGLAKAFLRRGQKVVINGRKDAQVREVVQSLQSKHGHGQVIGVAADICQFQDVKTLWDKALTHWGKVDIWINNAGMTTPRKVTWELSPEELSSVVQLNITGMMYCCKVALAGMLAQGWGHIYNFEGFGSNGRQFQPKLTPYGTTKSAVRYFTRSLMREAKGTAVKIGAISPGIVVTDLLVEPYKNFPEEWPRAKKIFNILGDKVETVTDWIADQVLRDPKSGDDITWLTGKKVMGRFLSAPFRKRDLFAETSIKESL